MGANLAHPAPGSETCKQLDVSRLVKDLRTIATCVLGFTELLRTAGLVDLDREAYLGVLHEQARRLAGIVELLEDAQATTSDALPKPPG